MSDKSGKMICPNCHQEIWLRAEIAHSEPSACVYGIVWVLLIALIGAALIIVLPFILN